MIKNKILFSKFSSWKFNVSKAKGSYIWDHKGKKLLDFTSAWNVTNLGWNHPEITQAIIKQAKKNTYAPGWTTDPIQIKYADLLTNSLAKELNVCVRATGGTEANEEALKTARAYTGREKIIGFKNTYHGQSFGTMAICFSPASVKHISPLVVGFSQLDFPEYSVDKKKSQNNLGVFLNKLENVLKKKDVAAIVTEAGIVTGSGSTQVAPKGYLKAVKKITEKYKTLLILDEVGTGFSRCGKLFGLEIESVVPDIVTFAKGMSNGAAAIGAMVTTKKIADETYDKTNIYSTFGWMPIACAAAIKTLEIHKRDKVWKKAKKDGNYLLKTLKKRLGNNHVVKAIKGIGMEIGVELDKNLKVKKVQPVDKVVELAREKGLNLVCDHESNIQLMPPLTIPRKDLDKGIDILIDVIKSLSK